MRPAAQMHVEWIDDEAVVLDTDTGHLHYLNPIAALAYALILEHGVDQGVKEFRKAKQIGWRKRKDIKKMVRDMVSSGLLEVEHG
jgi:GDP-D-mannose dehydratase